MTANFQDYITMKYEIPDDRIVKIFGRVFVENNKNKCIISMKEGEIEREIELCETIDLKFPIYLIF